MSLGAGAASFRSCHGADINARVPDSFGTTSSHDLPYRDPVFAASSAAFFSRTRAVVSKFRRS